MSSKVDYFSIQEIIKDETDFLIGLVDKIEDNLKSIISDNKKKNEDFGNSQIRNLLQAAKNASGIKEIELFIQYQMSRKNKWNTKAKGEKLGEAVIARLHDIEIKAKEKENLLSSPQEYRELIITMMQRFFLYMSWKYRYLSMEKESDKQQGKNRK